MYGIAPGTDFSFLIGVSLLQVCSGENEVILNFDEDLSIMIASNVSIRAPSNPLVVYDDARSLGAQLMAFVSETIADAVGSDDGALCLTWSNGVQMSLLDTWKEFESYVIRHGDQTFVV